MKKRRIVIEILIISISLCGCKLLDYASNSIIYRGNQATIADEKWSGEIYSVYRLNAHQNSDKSNEEYLYLNENGIYKYSMQEDIIEKVVENANINQFIQNKDSIYFIEQKGKDYHNKLIKKNLLTGEETVVFECEGSGFHFNIYNGYLLYGYVDYKDTYICPIEENIATNSINMNTLFSEEDISGKEQKLRYQGMVISRYFDLSRNYYQIKCVREEKSNRVLLFEHEAEVDYYGKQVVFKSNFEAQSTPQAFQYKVDGEDEWKPLSCYKNSESGNIYEKFLNTENGEIFGVIQGSRMPWINPIYYQSNLDRDILFQLDPTNGKNSITYETKDNKTRIIGYENSTIYLLKNYKIYRQKLNEEKQEELFTLPESKEYAFDWQGDYLIVIHGNDYDYNIAMTYKVNE